MRYLALATDFDGTLTSTDRVSPETIEALDRLRASGRRCILVTGRRLSDLINVCNCVDRFDYVVAENGGVLCKPSTMESTVLAAPHSPELVQMLRKRRIAPLEIGEVVISTRVPHQSAVLDAIRETGLELKVVFNRGAVMVLPPGINKATGLHRALRELGLSFHELVGIGDAENDHSFLQASECAVAVSNAVEPIKRIAAVVTQGPAGAGVIEIIDQLVATDLAEIDSRLSHLHITLGRRLDGTDVLVPPYGRNILIAGPSGSGKSSLAAGFVERLAGEYYQVCIIDPEGDYARLAHLVTLGDEVRVPSFEEILAVLRDPGINLNINLLGVRLPDRPEFFEKLLPHLQAMRARTSRPHWLLIDEAHHLMPESWGTMPLASPVAFGETILITVHPDHLSPTVLQMVDVVVAVGDTPDRTLRQFTQAVGRAPLPPLEVSVRENRAACWFTREASPPFPMEVIHARAERIRHYRKYALGELGDRSFYFRGRNQLLNLKAQNLALFCQIAAGLDDDTWLFHLRRGDYSNWLRIVIKDDELATLGQELEQRHDLDARETRYVLCDAISSRYSLPE